MPYTIAFRDVQDFDAWLKANAQDGSQQLADEGVGYIEISPAITAPCRRFNRLRHHWEAIEVPAIVRVLFRTDDGRLFYWELGQSHGSSEQSGTAIEVTREDPRVHLRLSGPDRQSG